jgi:hypothetical protein
MAATTKSVTLDSPANWKPWYYVTKSVATDGEVDVWQYVNPDLAVEPAQPTEPQEPTPELINASKQTVQTLDSTELNLYRMLTTTYNTRLRLYEQKTKEIRNVRKHIRGTISEKNITVIENLDTPYQILKALKKRLAPTDQARQIEVAKEYGKLKHYNKRQKVEDYLTAWETTYSEATTLDLPDVSGNRSQLDFTQAIRAIDASYASTQDYHLSQKARNSEPLPQLYDLIEDFRNNYRRIEAAKGSGSGSHSAFGTHRDQDQNRVLNCLCGEKHMYKECNYINALIRPKGWEGKPEIFEKINYKVNLTTYSWMPKRKERFLKEFNYNSDIKPQATKNIESTESTGKSAGSYATVFKSFHTAQHNAQEEYQLYNCWTLDGASDVHVCNDSTRSFTATRRAGPEDVLYAGKECYQIEAFGTVKVWINTPQGRQYIELLNVALAPGFMTNLVSLDILASKDVHWESKKPNHLQTLNGDVFCWLQKIDNHWVLESNAKSNVNSSFTTSKSSNPRHITFTEAEMHVILAHASPEVISHVKHAADDITIDSSIPCPATIQCPTCSVSKATEIVSRRTEVEDQATDSFDRISYDLIPLKTAYNGNHWVSHFHCTTKAFNIVYTHRSKSESTAIVEEVLNLIKNKYGTNVRFLRTDGETSLGNDFDTLIKERGIQVERSAPDTQAQNGDSERSGRTIITKARAIQTHARLPHDLWPEAVQTTGYILNRTPTRKLGWKTPYEGVKNKKPRLAHLHPFGCKAYALQKHIPKLEKLNPRAHVGYFVGYDSTNIFRIWIPSKNTVIRTRDVTFDHTSFYDPRDVDTSLILQQTATDLVRKIELPERSEIKALGEVDDEVYDTIVVDVPFIPRSKDTAHLPSPEATPPPQPTDSVISVATPSSTGSLSPPPDSPLQGAIGNSAPRGNEISSQLDESNILIRPRRSAHATALLRVNQLSGYHSAFGTALKLRTLKHRDTLPSVPKNWTQMLAHPHATEWRKAADTEVQTLQSKGTYEYVKSTHSKETKPLPLMWVFSYKFDEDGYLAKHKARLCARGDLQTTNQDTYAATLAAQTFRAIMAIVAAFDLETRAYDAINAFVNAKLSQPLPCQCPEGYEKEGCILMVLRALYGLKESPALWFKDFSTTLAEFELYPAPGVNCLYTNSWLILMFYVDDIIITYSKEHKAKVEQFESKLLAKYEVRVLGEATQFLGIRIVRDRPQKKLWLIQDAYIDNMQHKFNVIVTKTPKTPLPSTELRPYDGEATPEQTYGYQQRVGSLNFTAVITRPDIARAISKLSEYLQNPSPQHVHAADQALQYVVGTKYLALEFDGNQKSQEVFLSWSDAAFADHKDTRYSSNGFVFKLFGGVIHYKATKQKTVTTSSTEAEFLALSMTAKEFLWWIRLFKYLKLKIQDKPSIYCDNTQTIRLLQKETPKLDTKLKHVDIHQSWLRQEVQEQRINVEWVPTANMVADGFTKELPAQKHAAFVRQLNLKDISHILQKQE